MCTSTLRDLRLVFFFPSFSASALTLLIALVLISSRRPHTHTHTHIHTDTHTRVYRHYTLKTLFFFSFRVAYPSFDFAAPIPPDDAQRRPETAPTSAAATLQSGERIFFLIVMPHYQKAHLCRIALRTFNRFKKKGGKNFFLNFPPSKESVVLFKALMDTTMY